jgi:Coenzyme PQQ synthesis protein D (PqqD)
VRLNRTASMILRACESGTAANAVDALAERYPGVPRSELEPAVLGTVRKLVDVSVLAPARAQVETAGPADEQEVLAALP